MWVEGVVLVRGYGGKVDSEQVTSMMGRGIHPAISLRVFVRGDRVHGRGQQTSRAGARPCLTFHI